MSRACNTLFQNKNKTSVNGTKYIKYKSNIFKEGLIAYFALQNYQKLICGFISVPSYTEFYSYRLPSYCMESLSMQCS